MAEPTVNDVLKKVDDTIAAVQDAQETVVEYIGKLAEHDADIEKAHCGLLKNTAAAADGTTIVNNGGVLIATGDVMLWDADTDYQAGWRVKDSNGKIWEVTQVTGPNTDNGVKDPADEANSDFYSEVGGGEQQTYGPATTDALGLVKIGEDLDVAADGTVRVSGYIGDKIDAHTTALNEKLDDNTGTICDKLDEIVAAIGSGGAGGGGGSYVYQPLIDIPEQLYPKNPNGFKINISKFAISTNAPEAYVSTDVKITNDINGEDIVHQGTYINDDENTVTVPRDGILPNLQDGNDYFIFCRYNGLNYGRSNWSMPRKTKVISTITTKQGWTIERHDSDRGSVLNFDLGSYSSSNKGSIFFADAQYYLPITTQSIYSYGSGLVNQPGLISGTSQTSTGTVYTGNIIDATDFTREFFQRMYNFIVSNSEAQRVTNDNATHATKYNEDKVYAAKLRTDYSVFSGGYQVPTIQSVLLYNIVRPYIFSLDPTIESYGVENIDTSSFMLPYYWGYSSKYYATRATVTKDSVTVHQGAAQSANGTQWDCIIIPTRIISWV